MIKMTFKYLMIFSLVAMQNYFTVRDYASKSKPIEHTIFNDLLKKHVNTEGYVNYKGFFNIVEVEKTLIQTDNKPNHAVFNDILFNYVSNDGKVNYKGLKTDKAKLDTYLKELETKVIQENWSKEEKLAYWLNAYNAYTLKLIISHYPLKSIMDLDGGKTWDVKRITIGDKKYSLNNIENDIIRPQFKDARIHFAVNCAAKSCPPLANKAFTAENVNDLLSTRTRQFINSSANTITANSVSISKIFEWYGDDFGNIITFINKYSNRTVSKTAKIAYKTYDWSLNE